MTPFDDPTVAKRAWCLFEAVIAMREQVEILPVTPPSQRLLLRGKMLESVGKDVLINAMMRIDSSKAQATVPTDLERIQDLIKQSVPGQHVEVDNIFKNVIRAWIRGECSGLFETTFDAQSEDAARFAHNVGSLLDSVGDYPKALEFYNKALVIKKATDGENHISLAATYTNMGNVYQSQGDYPKALEFYSKALAITKATHGENHISLADTYNNMGEVYRIQGDYPKALEFYSKALVIKKATHGEKHISLASTYTNVGIVYQSQGDYPKALEFYSKALAIQKATHGENHISIAVTYGNMGGLFEKQGEFDKAIQYAQQTLDLFRTTFGDDHPNTKKATRGLQSAIDAKNAH